MGFVLFTKAQIIEEYNEAKILDELSMFIENPKLYHNKINNYIKNIQLLEQKNMELKRFNEEKLNFYNNSAVSANPSLADENQKKVASYLNHMLWQEEEIKALRKSLDSFKSIGQKNAYNSPQVEKGLGQNTIQNQTSSISGESDVEYYDDTDVEASTSEPMSSEDFLKAANKRKENPTSPIKNPSKSDNTSKASKASKETKETKTTNALSTQNTEKTSVPKSNNTKLSPKSSNQSDEYRVQLSAFNSKVLHKYFEDGSKQIELTKLDNRNVLEISGFLGKDEAIDFARDIRKTGVGGAFVTMYQGGERVEGGVSSVPRVPKESSSGSDIESDQLNESLKAKINPKKQSNTNVNAKSKSKSKAESTKSESSKPTTPKVELDNSKFSHLIDEPLKQSVLESAGDPNVKNNELESAMLFFNTSSVSDTSKVKKPKTP
jgi:hypothetical protein